MKKSSKTLVCIFAVSVMSFSCCSVGSAEEQAVSKGDIVQLGTYEQDADNENGKEKIEWEVLSVEDGKALLISRFALDCMPYHETLKKVTWENCSLRSWLNQEFLEEAFTAEEQNLILETKLSNHDNREYKTEAGNDTTDRIFLLSLDEVEDYYEIKEENFGEAHEEMICRLTDYGRERFIEEYAAWYQEDPEKAAEYIESCEEKYGKNFCVYWLRSPGSFSLNAASIFSTGVVGSSGNYVYYTPEAVRPAMWVETDHLELLSLQ